MGKNEKALIIYKEGTSGYILQELLLNGLHKIIDTTGTLESISNSIGLGEEKYGRKKGKNRVL